MRASMVAAMLSHWRGPNSTMCGASSRRLGSTWSGPSGKLTTSGSVSPSVTPSSCSVIQASGVYDRYSMPGSIGSALRMRSALSINQRWLIITPLGLLVVPEV